ncbi:hypothetical protein ACQ86N_16415 [Puia sp. P3]|uniref:hypothetical protein n=1 Tax=Puia sp. P3 TaxID=3423952 RepID=UPI003D678662
MLHRITLSKSATTLQEVTVRSNSFNNSVDRLGTGTQVSGQALRRIPIATRNYTDLMSLSPLANGASLAGAETERYGLYAGRREQPPRALLRYYRRRLLHLLGGDPRIRSIHQQLRRHQRPRFWRRGQRRSPNPVRTNSPAPHGATTAPTTSHSIQTPTDTPVRPRTRLDSGAASSAVPSSRTNSSLSFPTTSTRTSCLSPLMTTTSPVPHR